MPRTPGRPAEKRDEINQKLIAQGLPALDVMLVNYDGQDLTYREMCERLFALTGVMPNAGNVRYWLMGTRRNREVVPA